MIRRGFEFKEEEEQMSQEELRKFYYSPKELQAQESALKELYGDDIKGL